MRDDPEAQTAKSNADEELDADPLVGCMLSGKYRVLEKIGEGGMSVVYKAHDEMLDRTVAIKCLSGDVQEEGLTRFRREGIATGKLNSPHIVNVHELFLAPEQNPYLVMDYVDGEPLSNIIRINGALNVKRAIHIIIQAAQALEHAHSRGIVHRDIKPSNMIVTTVGGDHNFVKIVDFGIAKLQTPDEHGQQQLTKAGDVFGSPIYMSPEQCSGLPADSRSDIYSLGCVFFEMLVGEPPLLGANALQTMRKHVEQLPLKPSELRTIKGLSPNIENVIMRCLEKNPINRYQNLRAFVNDLNKEEAPQLSSGFSFPGRAHPYWVPVAVGLGLCGFAFLKYFYPMSSSPDSTQSDSGQLSQESEVVPEVNPDKQTVAKPAVTAETKPETKSEKKQEEEPKTKPKEKALTKPEVKAKAKPEAKAETKPKPEPKPEPKRAVSGHGQAIAILPPPEKETLTPISTEKGKQLKQQLDAAAFDTDNQDFAGAAKKYRKLLPLAASVYGDTSRDYARVVEKIIDPANRAKDIPLAIWATKTALYIHQKLGDQAGMARLYGWMGWFTHVEHHDAEAIKYFAESYKLGYKIPHTSMMYGDVLKSAKRYPEAERVYIDALDQCNKQNHRVGLAVLKKLKGLYKDWGRPDKVKEVENTRAEYKSRWKLADE